MSLVLFATATSATVATLGKKEGLTVAFVATVAVANPWACCALSLPTTKLHGSKFLFSPAWSPDGNILALVFSANGNAQIYLSDLVNSEFKLLENSNSINVEPEFSPNAEEIYFVSDRSGFPQIYKIPITGGIASRITFTDDHAFAPAISPDGRWMAFISKIKASYKLQLMELSSKKITPLTDTDSDSSPSFSPDGKLILYTTKIQSQEMLMTISIDGKLSKKISIKSPKVREAHFGPFLKQPLEEVVVPQSNQLQVLKPGEGF